MTVRPLTSERSTVASYRTLRNVSSVRGSTPHDEKGRETCSVVSADDVRDGARVVAAIAVVRVSCN